MIKHSLLATTALIASVSLAAAQKGPGPQAGEGGGASPPSASDQAPGQVKEPGTPAKEVAPGQKKSDGMSAKEEAPGQRKTRDETDSGDAATKGGKDRMGEANQPRARDGGKKPGAAAADNREPDSEAAGRTVGKSEAAANDDGKIALSKAPPETKTKVRSAFSRHRVEPARGLNVSISVGVEVPRSVKLYAVPEDIIVLLPAYRSYRYFYVDDRICIVDPNTYEIVEVIIIV